MITVDINLPQGTKIEKTTNTVLAIEKHMRDSLTVNKKRTEGIVDWSSYIGKGPTSYDLGYSVDEANSNYAHILVNTSDFLINNKLIYKLNEYCFNNFPNADIKIKLLVLLTKLLAQQNN
jgi:multidrug efflux pump subunit AcrB